MSNPFEISDRFTEAWADLSPIDATLAGIPGRDHLCSDFSPDGEAARVDLYRSTRGELHPQLGHPDPVQRRAARVMIGWLDEAIDDYEQRRWVRDINHISSPFQWVTHVFEVMPRNDQRAWENIVARLEGMPGMLTGYRASLADGISTGETAARRQTEAVLAQVRAAGERFSDLPEQAASAGAHPERVAQAVTVAVGACGEFGDWLEQVYLPAADPRDAVGAERYQENVDRFLGMSLDLDETYEWGWSEVARLRSEMAETSRSIDPDKTLEEVIEMLDTDPSRAAATREEFVEFISRLQQDAVANLDGTHFEVPDELKVVTVNIAPPGGALGAWYMPPSEDFSRPGSIWYAPGERKMLPYWQEVTTAYHEGFPGHHLQGGVAVQLREKLSRFHRMAIWYPGSGEGWALYAERLMDELSYFENPGHRLGYLSSQLFRATRVVVDIGCHLEKRIPDDASLHAGEVWDYGRAVDYIEKVGLQARDIAESEVTRYLGLWAQAISYKVGEREILEIRAAAEATSGDGFDRKELQRRILEASAIRLDQVGGEVLCAR
jgi:uncharacterized protein (DUF885 family)